MLPGVVVSCRTEVHPWVSVFVTVSRTGANQPLFILPNANTAHSFFFSVGVKSCVLETGLPGSSNYDYLFFFQ